MDYVNSEKKSLEIVNRLLVKYAENCKTIRSVKDINSDLIVLLFENITKNNVPDLLASETKETEAHNVQAVIDTLSLDILGLSLSHITGEGIVDGDLVSIYDLLEVFEGVGTYLNLRKHDQPILQGNIIKQKVMMKKASITASNPSTESDIQESSVTTTQSDNPLQRIAVNKKLNFSSSSLKSKTVLLEDSKSSTLNKQKFNSLPEKQQFNPISIGLQTTFSTVNEESKQESEIERNKSDPPNVVKQNLKRKICRLPRRVNIQPPLVSSCEANSLPEKQQFNPISIKLHTNFSTVKENSKQKSDIERNISKANNPPYIVKRNLKRKICRLPRKENIEPSLASPHKQIEEMYESNLETKIRGLLNENNCTSRASNLKNMQLQNLRKPLKRLPIASCKKSFLLPHSLRSRAVSYHSPRRKSSRKSINNQYLLKHKKKILNENQKSFLQGILDEFPEHHLTPQIISLITDKYQQHLLTLHKQVKSILFKRPKTQKQAEEAIQKQVLLRNIAKKDIQHQQQMKSVKEQKKFENQFKFKLRDAQLQSAKMKQYCEEFQIEMRKKMQKRNYSEELVIEGVFKECLKIQKEQVDQLCQGATEISDADARQHLVYLEALENLYQTQFSMLAESIAQEKKEEQIRTKAEQLEMNALKREFEKQLKEEVRFMQKVIVDCAEDIHFREMDAEQLKTNLRKR